MNEIYDLTIRRTASHAVRATIEKRENGVALKSLSAHQGVVPEFKDWIDVVFPNAKALRQAVVARMRALSRNEPQISTLDQVLISANAGQRWQAVAAANAHRVRQLGEDIPDEQVEPMPSGELRVFVKLPGGSDIEMLIPADEWAWR